MGQQGTAQGGLLGINPLMLFPLFLGDSGTGRGALGQVRDVCYWCDQTTSPSPPRAGCCHRTREAGRGPLPLLPCIPICTAADVAVHSM